MWVWAEVAWWVIVAASARQAGRRWGPSASIASVLGLWLLAVSVDPQIGLVVTAAFAALIGARAERGATADWTRGRAQHPT